MSKNLLLFGGGGHSKSVIDSLLSLNQYDRIGILDLGEKIGSEILGIKIIGSDDDYLKMYEQGFRYAFITIGSMEKTSLRIEINKMIEDVGFIIPNIIDGSAVVSNYATLGKGVYIGKKAVINAGATIDNNSIINTNVVVEHDCKVGKFSQIAPGAVLCGAVHIGNNTFIGAGSVIKQQVKIGSNTIIGMGSVVTKDINSNVVAYGNPCTEVRSL